MAGRQFVLPGMRTHSEQGADEASAHPQPSPEPGSFPSQLQAQSVPRATGGAQTVLGGAAAAGTAGVALGAHSRVLQAQLPLLTAGLCPGGAAA